jgi:hypothetical protein
LNWSIVGAFVAAVLLHTACDTVGSVTGRISISWVGMEFAGLIVIGLVSLVLLIWRMRQADLRHPSHFGGAP